MGEPIRLQKILASAGFGSRRGCETFITEGRVSVDGAVVSELGAKADIESQSVELDGRKIAGPGKLSKSMRENDERVYYALNKPKGALCTNDDPAGRPVAVQMIPEKRRIFCVGRLDLDTEGLILLTNDGDLTNRLTHPRYGVPKTYLARVEGEVGPGQMYKLQTGMHLAEGRTQGAKVRVRRREGRHAVLEITISEGMNRQVRRMLARVELKCRSLKRIAIGPIKLGELDAGESRRLTADELARLNVAIAEAEAAGKAPKAPRAESSEREGKSEKGEKGDRGNKPERISRGERGANSERDERARQDRADKHKFKKIEHVEDEEIVDDEDEFDDDDEDAFAAASKLVAQSGGSEPSKRRVIDSDDAEDADDEVDVEDDDFDISEFVGDDDDEETEEDKALMSADAKADAAGADDKDDETDEAAIAADAVEDERSTQETVALVDESRPWEKVAAKTGKAWADRGDTVHDPELVAAAAENERLLAKQTREKAASETEGDRDVRDRGEKRYQENRLRAGERKTRAPRDDSRGGKPYEKRAGAGRPGEKSFADGERRPREYGERKGHTPRPWEKTREGGSDRPRTFSKPGGFDRGSESNRRPSYNKPRERDSERGGSSDRPRTYSKPGGYDRGGSSSGERKPYVKREGGYDRGGSSSGERKPYVKREGGYDRGGSSSGERKPYVKREGGYDRGGSSSGERKPYVKREGGYDRGGSSDRPRTYSKPGGYDRGGSSSGERKPYVKREGGYDRGGSSDRPRTYSKPGGYDRGGSSSGERKPYVKREGGYDRGGARGGDRGDRGARPSSSSTSRSRPWENARPSGERSEGGGNKGVRPWENKD